jgi:hypothetical protein
MSEIGQYALTEIVQFAWVARSRSYFDFDIEPSSM